MNFTNDQNKIIEARGCNLLVSAAAGSGKTAVMVERIIQLITDHDHPVDIDRFLVVTFTRAAAAQMREKIVKAINALLDDNPSDVHLQRQSALIHNALITTIDSFCLNILRNNISELDIEPGFRIADENEVKLLRRDVLEEVIEDLYAQDSESFRNMTESLSAGASDIKIEEIIQKLYDTAMSAPWPEEWLDEHSKDYYVNQEQPSISGSWFENILSDIHDRLMIDISGLHNTIQIALLPGGPAPYLDNLEAELESITAVCDWIDGCEELDFDELRAHMEVIEFGRLKSCKAGEVDDDLKNRAKSLRDRVKEDINDIRSEYLGRSEAVNLEQMRRADKVTASLCEVTKLFKARLDQKMKEKGVLSFADCEHLALRILKENAGVAESFRDHFEYIMVDEYQDSNEIQESILSTIASDSVGRYNRFMVGDIKQSIYRFRQAKPEIFMTKYNEYKSAEGENLRRVDLHQNFRSRLEVLRFTNDLCEKVMSVKMGGVFYGDEASLHLGADYPGAIGDEYKAELMLIEKSPDPDESKDACEARGIGMRIKELMRSLQVRMDQKDASKGTRPLRYGDIVILLRSMKDTAGEYARVLEEMDIPVHVTGVGGFFKTYEIQVIMNLLRILVNPRQDIYLYGVMESVIGGFSTEELALIRGLYIKSLGDDSRTEPGYLYDACQYVTTVTDYAELRNKTVAFLDMIEEYRNMSVYLSTEELIAHILRATDYRALVLAMKGGEKRLANVDMLLKKASDYTKTSYFGLHNFIRYVDTINKYDVDDYESETIDENADVVRIMSIHKSKGLEFPVCFVSKIDKHFNMQDSMGAFIVDGDEGIGLMDVCLDKRIRSKTLRQRAIARKIVKDTKSEELRILYVALTRAEEKLILTAVSDDFEASIENWRGRMSDGEVTPAVSGCASSYYDWICMAMASGDISIDIHKVSYADIACANLAESIELDMIKQEHKVNITRKHPVNDYLESLLSNSYSHIQLKGLYAKTSVSELKHSSMPEETEAVFELFNQGIDTETAEYEPRFISGKPIQVGATLRGSAFHRMLELLKWSEFDDLSDSEVISSELRKQIDECLVSGRLASEYESVFTGKNINQFISFIGSETGIRMHTAELNNKLHREAPFMIGLPATLLDAKYPQEEIVLIQGIIDAYWEEEDGYVILDYKTDRVSSEKELIDRYQTQLDYYERALSQMRLNVKEKLIYSFELGKVIRL